MTSINVFSEALRMFSEKDPHEIAENSGAIYNPTNNTFCMKYLNSMIKITHPTGEITHQTIWPLTKNDHVLILQYLVFACGAKPRDTWITFLQLPDGPHHHSPFVSEAIEPLAREFGNNLEMFKKRIVTFGGQEIQMGNYGAVIPVFPYIPMAVCLWLGDEEFAATANILFDITAPIHLTTAALWVLGTELSQKLRNQTGQQYINEKV